MFAVRMEKSLEISVGSVESDERQLPAALLSSISSNLNPLKWRLDVQQTTLL